MSNGTLRNMATVYIRDKDKMLLLDRIGSKVVQRSWCGIGGHFKGKELNNARACVLRELKEETGLKEKDVSNLKLRYIALRLVEEELRINYYFFADLNPGAALTKHCPEGNLEWVGLNELHNRKMPYTAQRVIGHYMEIGINTNDFYCAAVDNDHFSIHSLGVS